MAFGIYDDEQDRILTDEEIDKEGLYLDRRGAVCKFAVNWRHSEDYSAHWVYVDPKDVSERYKPLMKVGCG